VVPSSSVSTKKLLFSMPAWMPRRSVSVPTPRRATNSLASLRETGVLMLVDGSSYLYRAYHALPDLRGPGDGPPAPSTASWR
jgi:hypothetical protein